MESFAVNVESYVHTLILRRVKKVILVLCPVLYFCASGVQLLFIVELTTSFEQYIASRSLVDSATGEALNIDLAL